MKTALPDQAAPLLPFDDNIHPNAFFYKDKTDDAFHDVNKLAREKQKNDM